ncbi:HAMP domain-containing histidine kinase [Spiribacter vilamensis]|uniref:histidine kinase n=2 Tax=Spiribacter vilamensis TaxID=531306 RepID=A0A4Q8CZE4_9GAMM|nr:signal transduction histidine kinase [Spiribacter vilamensis]TVO62313.1 HAMP domain-containing histidine kinase [Spiribacter vilamensis]
MLAGAGLMILLVLPVAGLLLSWNFQQSINTAFDERLGSLLNVVLASLDYDRIDGSLSPPDVPGESRFSRIFSGWYWQVEGPEQTFTSRSLWDERLSGTDRDGPATYNVDGPDNHELRVIQRAVTLPGMDSPLYVTVAAPLDSIQAEMDEFNQLLWLSLLVLALILLTGLALQLRWGLAPLRHIQSDLSRVENGDRDRLNTDLPAELTGLANAMNRVLERDQSLIQRSRQTADNLAHALKTPIAVIGTLADRLPDDQRATLKGEIQRMDAAIRHHLSRASAAGPSALGASRNLAETLQPLLQGFERLAGRRQLECRFSIPDTISVRTDPQDLQEMVGNLIDNAAKWADRRFQLVVEQDTDSILFRVIDDGPGMSADARAAVMERGVKLDESSPGSGLGLAIARELAALYDGSLHLEPSETGGTEAQLRLPGQSRTRRSGRS